MKILVINAGSSSLKFQLFLAESEEMIARGHYLDIGDSVAMTNGIRKLYLRGEEEKAALAVRDHQAALRDMLSALMERGIIGGRGDIDAVGHRIVHGGEKYSGAARITETVLDDLKEIAFLAPLHNPIGIACVEALRRELPQADHYAVFDTAFHRTIPEPVYLYGLPREMYEKHGIRKYGFHGTNHRYVSRRAAELLGADITRLKIITCHLGNGQSICAIKNGRSIDTSMGFTPLEGLPMGTRSGSFDPEIIFFLMDRGYSTGDLKTIINRKSGLLGVSGITSDFKIIEERSRSGDARAKLAGEMLANRITCLIGAYIAEMEGVDVLVFTGGIGENAAPLRERVLGHFSYLGLEIDRDANGRNDTVITGSGSRVTAMVIPANEELQITREIVEVMRGSERP